MKESIAKFIGILIGVMILAPLALALSAAIGYLIGLFLAWAVGGLLTGILGITTANIPVITAWLFVITSLISTGTKEI